MEKPTIHLPSGWCVRWFWQIPGRGSRSVGFVLALEPKAIRASLFELFLPSPSFVNMKTIIWIAGSVLILGGVISFFSFRFKGIETPNYKVIKTLGDVEIREYPNMILAQTKLGSKQYVSSGNSGFSTVAGYIFGGNQQKQKIAMTAPVIMNMSDTDASMSFVMPSQYQLSDLPVPNSNAVSLVTQDSMTLAVLRFGGFSSDEKIAKYAQILTLVLQEKNIRTKGSLLYMGYNAPWDVINRRNEVAFQIDSVVE